MKRDAAIPPMQMVVACGGTGGHFYPGLSVARTAMAKGFSVGLFLTGRAAEDQAQMARSLGVPARVLPTLRTPVGLAGKAGFALRLADSVWRHRRELRASDAKVILAMGSFNSVPTVLAAALLGLPVILHEGNARIGKANRFLSRWARHLGIAFPPVNVDALRCPWSVTGMPLRPELRLPPPDRDMAMARLNRLHSTAMPLRSDLPTLLVFGGSQGARTLNQALPEAVRRLAQELPGAFQVVHLAGAASMGTVGEAYGKCSVPTLVLASSDDMTAIYAAADLVVCRAGGSTLAELALFGKGAILVPFPYATDRHQDDNAAHFTVADAALAVSDADCTPERICTELAGWLRQPDPWRQRGQRALALAHADAAERVFDLMAAAG
jgi:UDP-N-acetylglucosamine--N-acetylmuramyl-(pentapeptide) pyrophosphoryl-undecaprenol N-acetylglucosamine transferase